MNQAPTEAWTPYGPQIPIAAPRPSRAQRCNRAQLLDRAQHPEEAQHSNGAQQHEGAQRLSRAQRSNRGRRPQRGEGRNRTQQPNGLEGPNEASGSLTPLGEPMSPESILCLAEDPLRWHLQYWLSLGVVGILRGEDPMLTIIRIEIEQKKIPDRAIKTQLIHNWTQHWIMHRHSCQQYFEKVTLDSEEAKWYLRDLGRMLVKKWWKMHVCIRDLERKTIPSLDARTAREMSRKIIRINRKMWEEQRADKKARLHEAGSSGSGDSVEMPDIDGMH